MDARTGLLRESDYGTDWPTALAAVQQIPLESRDLFKTLKREYCCIVKKPRPFARFGDINRHLSRQQPDSTGEAEGEIDTTWLCERRKENIGITSPRTGR